MMRPWQSLTVIAANALVMSMIAAADAPFSLNPKPVYYASLERIDFAKQRLNDGLRQAIANKESKLSQTQQKANSKFCQPEFSPVAISNLSRLLDKEKRNETDIRKTLGQPCHSDNERIYYLLETGEVVQFSKRTGKGGFQS